MFNLIDVSTFNLWSDPACEFSSIFVISLKMNQKGSSLIFILIVVALTGIIAGSAFYLGNRTAGNSPAKNSSFTTPTPTVTPTQTASPAPSAVDSTSGLMKITRVYQAACTSSSCAQTTTLVIDGLNLNLVSVVNATGQSNHQDYGGILGNISANISANGQEIIVDFLNLPCQTYSGTASNPLSANSSVTFSFTPATCK